MYIWSCCPLLSGVRPSVTVRQPGVRQSQTCLPGHSTRVRTCRHCQSAPDPLTEWSRYTNVTVLLQTCVCMQSMIVIAVNPQTHENCVVIMKYNFIDKNKSNYETETNTENFNDCVVFDMIHLIRFQSSINYCCNPSKTCVHNSQSCINSNRVSVTNKI